MEEEEERQLVATCKLEKSVVNAIAITIMSFYTILVVLLVGSFFYKLWVSYRIRKLINYIFYFFILAILTCKKPLLTPYSTTLGILLHLRKLQILRTHRTVSFRCLPFIQFHSFSHLVTSPLLSFRLTLIIQVWFDDQTSYFQKVITYSYCLLAFLIVSVAAAEFTLTFFASVYVFHMCVDLGLAILYVFIGNRLLKSLRLFSMSHYKRSRKWIIYISTVLVISCLTRLGVEVYAY